MQLVTLPPAPAPAPTLDPTLFLRVCCGNQSWCSWMIAIRMCMDETEKENKESNVNVGVSVSVSVTILSHPSIAQSRHLSTRVINQIFISFFLLCIAFHSIQSHPIPSHPIINMPE